ncbi:serine/threonine protein kinase [Dictyobacter arantiisoli]|uniref:non-specific serine/threonine protein kinase n=1 Tax=Dictyobacter arantiisoli TaxID=2014874 RepID=A0A5A5T8D9_9CHLR|nr:serine/threonine-protein kinase [Dictyobacter arantiisoli]GCF07672.1 hypothetical protein KDI_12360 [Dictyobacter arantiisoli]
MRELPAKPPRGKVVRDRYIVEELLGQGGFGAVYRVRDRRVKGNIFALKEVDSPERRQRESVLFEGDVLRRLDHPALPRVYQVFEEVKPNRVCILMDYVAGPNLERLRLQQPEKRFPLPQIVRMMTPIVSALTYLHAQQPPIIHRDVKPSNIIIPTSGESAVLVDFGIAKEYDQDSTTTAIRHCSPGYGAPEQYVSGTNPQTDVYGLGATIYTLLTGTVPIDALYRITRMSVQRTDPLQPLEELEPTIPTPISAAVLRALSVNSNDRFDTVEDFWQVLCADLSVDTDTMAEAKPLSSSSNQAALPFPETPPATLSAASALTIEDVADVREPAYTTTRATIAPEVSTTYEEPQLFSPSQPGKAQTSRRFLPLLLFVLLLLIGGSAFAVASGVFAPAQPRTVVNPPIKHTPASVQTPLVRITSTSVAQKTHTATPVVTTTSAPPPSTPTTPPVSMPQLVGAYSGTIHNQPANVQSGIALSSIRQSRGTISGYLSLGAGLLGSGNFTGSVATNKHIQFLVDAYPTLLPLFFEGTIQSDGSISGTYCSYRNGQCDESNGHGYGTWSVTPASSAYNGNPIAASFASIGSAQPASLYQNHSA